MRYARWHESMETGYPKVDNQHRALYELVNDLNASSMLGASQERETDALSRIVRYASQHFATEEELMRRFDYSGMAEHCAVHAEFAEAVQGLVAARATGKGHSMRELAEFMENWLATHVSTFDRPLVDYVRAQPAHDSGE
jgi:hemerythrin